MTQQHNTVAAGVRTPSRTAPPPQQKVVAALFIDFGNDRGPADEQRPPRARYECVPCNYRSPIVTGAAAVRAFVETAAASHRAVCPSRQENHQ